ncbi:hypothetical protein F53441_13514 [Fusarium austroafricanum]|uniref:Uncharacterized protein n=1 Tax=Fusarium austroafricanum TaxID=2364996 RepID=A0A8H4NKP0_9HYPO|nr:hypothetical protein F53441_13514 [Fusarium austroafricanum]
MAVPAPRKHLGAQMPKCPGAQVLYGLGALVPKASMHGLSEIISLLAKGKELVTRALGPDLSVEITALLARAQDLLLHRGSLTKPFAPLDDVDRQSQPAASGGHQGTALLGWENEAIPATVEAEPNGQGNATRGTTRIQCPHKDCDDEEQTFSRPQDLDRHYALHYEHGVQCKFCDSHITAKEAMTHTCVNAAPSQITLIKRQRRTWRRRLREDVKKAQLLKNSVEQPSHVARSSSRGEKSAGRSDYPRDTMITAPADLISSAANPEGSTPNATLPPPQETSSLTSIITPKQTALPIGTDDLSIDHFLTQAPIYSLNPFPQLEPDQAAEPPLTHASICAEGLFAANWQGQARLGLTEQIDAPIDAPIYSLASLAHSPSMHAELNAQMLWDAMQPGPM